MSDIEARAGSGPDGSGAPLHWPIEPEPRTALDPPAPEDSGVGGVEADEELDLGELDEVDADLLPAASRRPLSRLTGLLIVGVVAAGAFGAGVTVQKAHDGSLTGGGGAQAAGFGGGGGFRGGGGGGAGGGGFGGGRGTGAGQGGAAAAGSAAGVPAVVGQVVSVKGNTLVVRNFGGRTITVTIPDGTTVTRQTPLDLTALKAGTVVAVEGTTGQNGTVTATSVTAR